MKYYRRLFCPELCPRLPAVKDLLHAQTCDILALPLTGIAHPTIRHVRLTTSAKKGAKAPKKAQSVKAEAVREGTKTEKVLDLLKRPGGTTMKELMKVTGWLPHSVRGFLSGTIGKKMGRKVESTKGEDGNRTYSVKG
jgi:hypothetical protein